ncbi:AraC family transcriptional regulator [Paenibacillaceae bacterium WGS1546]|uniref:AraC family transcriptional regulator n=1 Tax=Cohnella sp. WGS1546 TaxID=3366810 RepID=UPI00372D1368
MEKITGFEEPMPMPDPSFPIKVHPRHTHKMTPGGTLFVPHWHEHLEFLYFVSGSAIIECGSNPIAFREGDLCVVNSNELHYGVCQSDDLSYYAMILDISLLHSHSVDAVETKFITPITRNRILFRNRIANDGEIRRHMEAIIGEMQRKELGYELSVKSHLYALLTLLMRKYVATLSALDEYRLRLKELERLKPVFAYVEEHYRDKLTVEKLADVAGLSRYHFSRLFKQITDKSLIEYVNLIRVNKSEALLRNKGLTVSEIALATGFNDIYYFSRTFKKLKSMSPKEWRNAAL